MKLKLVLAALMIMLLATGCSAYTDGEGSILKRDMQYKTLGIITDKETGCQYINAIDAGITPRLDADGKVMGCKAR